MTKTVLFGGSGFFGPVLLSKDKNIISVGRTKPPKEIKNQHIHINSLDDLGVLDEIKFDKVIFLIGSSNHHEINLKSTMGIDFNVYPMIKIMSYLKKKILKNLYVSQRFCFTIKKK